MGAALRKYPNPKARLPKRHTDIGKSQSSGSEHGFLACAPLQFMAKKEPDAIYHAQGWAVPAGCFIEAGFSERESSLIQDAQLWLYGG